MNALFPDSLADASRVFILHEGDNPTSDFYLASRLITTKIEVEWLRLETLPDPERLNGAALVIVRYLNPGWHRFLSLHHHRLAHCVWLIDDDLFDFQVLWKVSGGFILIDLPLDVRCFVHVVVVACADFSKVLNSNRQFFTWKVGHRRSGFLIYCVTLILSDSCY